MSAKFEESFFFSGSHNQKLYGFLHGVAAEKKTLGLIYCHPFAEEKNMSHSILVKTARMFAKNGFPVLRFDLSGCGDSEGDLACVTIENWQDDLKAAVNVFTQKTGISDYIIWGLRLGAGLALLHAETDVKTSGLVLWQPVFDFRQHLQRFLRHAISSEIINKNKTSEPMISSVDKLLQSGEVSVIGYPITKKFYDSCQRINKQPSLVNPTKPTFLLSVSLMESASTALVKFADKLDKSGTPVTLQHVKAEPFWDRYWQWELDEVSELTLNWLRQLKELR